MQQIITWINDNKDVVIPFALAAYELLVRIKPTAKDWSILSLIMKLVNGAAPNKSSQGGTH